MAQGRVTESELPGGRAGTAVHHGDPRQIGATHDAIRAHLRAHGLQPAGVLWEVYGHPDETSGAFATEVFHLVA